MTFDEFLSYTLWENTIKDYILTIVVFILAVIIFRIIKYEIVQKLKSAADKTKIDIDNVLVKVVDKIGWPFYIFFAVCISIKFIQLPDIVSLFFSYAVPIVIIFIIVRSLQQFVDYGLRKVAKEKEIENETSLVNVLSRIIKGSLWALAFVYILSLWGQDITSIVASFGVIGIVLAFGLQHVLSDIFASFSIFFDKPFEIGDFIIVENDLGVVKNVGIKSTRIQSIWGQEVIIPNKKLTSSRINNYKKMERRRVQFNFGLIYDTSAEKLEEAISITKDVINKIDLTELDRVHFKEYGDFSLNFEVVYYVNTPDYNKYMDIQQEINLTLKKRFEKKGISFAYPTQTVIVNKEKQ